MATCVTLDGGALVVKNNWKYRSSRKEGEKGSDGVDWSVPIRRQKNPGRTDACRKMTITRLNDQVSVCYLPLSDVEPQGVPRRRVCMPRGRHTLIVRENTPRGLREASENFIWAKKFPICFRTTIQAFIGLSHVIFRNFWFFFPSRFISTIYRPWLRQLVPSRTNCSLSFRLTREILSIICTLGSSQFQKQL